DVCDQGPGIAQDDIERVLKPFSRGETARTGSAGAGLGLSIVQRLLARADGNLALMVAQPNGLIARMDLPRARSRGKAQTKKGGLNS
ncbi:MAG TPA: ATP-binding protein, partial [Orrella sp.]